MNLRLALQGNLWPRRTTASTSTRGRLLRIVRAAKKNFQAGKTRQGAKARSRSKLARNSFPVELPSNDRGYSRKLLKMFVGSEIERRYSKGRSSNST